MKWVTRERPQVDRIACPWLIKRFVDPEAEFLYAPRDQVLAVAQREGATAYDIPDAELAHHGQECSFDAIVNKYELAKNDPAMARLALIVRLVPPPGRPGAATRRWPIRTFIDHWLSLSLSSRTVIRRRWIGWP